MRPLLAPLLLVASFFLAAPSAPADEFQPPPELAEDFGPYRSPLQFANGEMASTSAQWARRRAEIRAAWMEVLGECPPLLPQPKLEVLSRQPRDGFEECRVQVEIAPGVLALGYLLVPPGQGRKPAVFVPYYDAETSIGRGKELRDFAYQLTLRGFVTLAIGSPGGDARKPELSGAKCQPLAYLAYIAANCGTALANLPEVDPQRIGIVGHSYGGKWAMFASCLYERFACAVWSDLGIVWDETSRDVNYWDPWYLGAEPGAVRPPGLPDAAHPRTGAYRLLRERGMDLPELHALMAPRPFLVSGGAVDRPTQWRALNHARAVNRLLGFSDRVAFTSRETHAPTAESNAQLYAFFERFLK